MTAKERSDLNMIMLYHLASWRCSGDLDTLKLAVEDVEAKFHCKLTLIYNKNLGTYRWKVIEEEY